MHNERNMERALPLDEARELQANLTPAEWEAFLAVHAELVNAPMLAPSATFTNRVRARVNAREAARARRRNLVGVIAFGMGAVVVSAWILIFSPANLLLEPSNWAG